MSKKQAAAIDARQLMLSELSGVLSTHSLNMPGYPFGSVLPFCLDENGFPVIQVAQISQHTRNMEADPKVSLIICESGVNDVLTGKRLTLVGEAEKIEDANEIAELYYQFFPQGRDYLTAHPSVFFRIKPTRSRYIGGFAQAFWFDNEAVIKANPLLGETALRMINHMNMDHADALVKYCTAANVELAEDEAPVMVGIDLEGMHLRIEDRVVRIEYPEVAEDAVQVRQQLVAMAQSA